MEVSLNLLGDDFFRYKLRKMGRRALNMKPVMHSLGEDWQDMIESGFATEGRTVIGRQWHDLTIEYASSRGSAHPILTRTGDLLLAMTNPDIVQSTHDSVTIRLPDAERQKAEAAQYGFHTRDGSGPESSVRFVEPRPLVDFGVLERFWFTEKITDYLVNGRIAPLSEYIS